MLQVRETRRAVRDSSRGIEKMAIGHHIQDRAHVIERKRDAHTGEQEENQELINLDDGKFQFYLCEYQKLKKNDGQIPSVIIHC